MLAKIKLRVQKFTETHTMFMIYLGIMIGLTGILSLIYCLHERAVRLREEKYVALEGGRYPSVERLRRRVWQLNQKLRVHNQALAADERAPVLVVQAGRAPARLAALLRSLWSVRGIETALLVVSHSYYDPELNELVRGVRFCRVVQIFFPNSLQLHPDRFPGPDPGKCADAFCSARDPARCEHKQHWWWTAHYLFNHIICNDRRKGEVVFLQDDSVVAPDLLHMLQYAQRALTHHPEAELIALGGPHEEDADYGLLRVDPWWPPYDQGLVFNRSLWAKVEALAERFCAHDDTSWSYSLLNVFAGFPRGHADAVACAASRVLRAGDRNGVRDAGLLFPRVVRSVFLAAPGGRREPRMRAPRGAGGWADLRDQLLCLDPFLVTTINDATITTEFSQFNETV